MPPEILGIDCVRLHRDSLARNKATHHSRCRAGLTNGPPAGAKTEFAEEIRFAHRQMTVVVSWKHMGQKRLPVGKYNARYEASRLWVFCDAVEPFNAYNSRRKWRSGVPLPVIVLLLTLAVAFLIFVLLRMRPCVSPAIWCIACGLLGLLLVLDDPRDLPAG